MLTVFKATLRQGFRALAPGPEQFNAAYVIATDGALLPGDIVVYARSDEGVGAGAQWYAEWDNGAGIIPLANAGAPFSPDGGITTAGKTGTLLEALVTSCGMYYQLIDPLYLDDGAGNPLLRFGFETTSAASRFQGAAFAVWVIRSVTFNSIPVGSQDAKVAGFVCPFDLTPAPGQGVLTANQLLFGLSYLQSGGGNHVLDVSQSLGVAGHELTASDLWNNVFGQNSFASASIWAGPTQDLTGALSTFDTIPTGETLPDADLVASQAGAIFGLLDLTEVAPAGQQGFGFGGVFAQ